MQKSDSISVLIASTSAFVVCFAVWMMFGVIGIPVRDMLRLNATEFGLLTAMPVLTGAVFRLPLGIWTDRFGGRVMFMVLLLGCAIPVWLVGFANAYWQFLVLGLFLGLVGASFAVGTPYVARFFAKQQQGFAMGVFGAGTSGAALNMFVAPWIIDHYGWRTVPTVYAVALLVTAVIFWLLSRPDPGVRGRDPLPLRAQFAVLRSARVWRYCQYYSIVFGGFTALSLWMTQYYTQEYRFGIAQAALLAAAFSLPAGVMRAAGGWLADRLGAHSVTWWVLWVSWICLFLLSYPQTELTIHTVNGPVSFHIGLQPWLFTALLFVIGIAFAFGMASTFKYVAADFPDE
ncbi:MAG: MFS transporter, partial [Burkholderiales bacterium]